MLMQAQIGDRGIAVTHWQRNTKRTSVMSVCKSVIRGEAMCYDVTWRSVRATIFTVERQ